MPKIEFKSMEELRKNIGREIAVGDWRTVTQEQINLFAEATGDHQWIHLDEKRAAAESPYGTTIAHGFLTLSLIPPHHGGYDQIAAGQDDRQLRPKPSPFRGTGSCRKKSTTTPDTAEYRRGHRWLSVELESTDRGRRQ